MIGGCIIVKSSQVKSSQVKSSQVKSTYFLLTGINHCHNTDIEYRGSVCFDAFGAFLRSGAE